MPGSYQPFYPRRILSAHPELVAGWQLLLLVLNWLQDGNLYRSSGTGCGMNGGYPAAYRGRAAAISLTTSPALAVAHASAASNSATVAPGVG